MPAAAAVPLRNSDDIAQNGPSVPQIPIAASASAASSAAGDFSNAAAINPITPAHAEIATGRDIHAREVGPDAGAGVDVAGLVEERAVVGGVDLIPAHLVLAVHRTLGGQVQ